ncbi:hypothetical protein [Nonomuraea dietziae]|uniref:hypothetical protein n=1 Tax=Nonomuraea dietziae TaxID=65515 RepID=UPI0031D40135
MPMMTIEAMCRRTEPMVSARCLRRSCRRASMPSVACVLRRRPVMEVPLAALLTRHE